MDADADEAGNSAKDHPVDATDAEGDEEEEEEEEDEEGHGDEDMAVEETQAVSKKPAAKVPAAKAPAAKASAVKAKAVPAPKTETGSTVEADDGDEDEEKHSGGASCDSFLLGARLTGLSAVRLIRLCVLISVRVAERYDCA